MATIGISITGIDTSHVPKVTISNVIISNVIKSQVATIGISITGMFFVGLLILEQSIPAYWAWVREFRRIAPLRPPPPFFTPSTRAWPLP